MLVKHNEEQVYRVKVVTAFLKAGVPLSKIGAFQDLLEENAYYLTDQRNMLDYVPFILKDEENKILQEISEKNVSAIFDGTPRLGEALAVVLHFMDDDFSLKQHVIKVSNKRGDSQRAHHCAFCHVQYLSI